MPCIVLELMKKKKKMMEIDEVIIIVSYRASCMNMMLNTLTTMILMSARLLVYKHSNSSHATGRHIFSQIDHFIMSNL